jgi:hypothetical protein
MDREAYLLSSPIARTEGPGLKSNPASALAGKLMSMAGPVVIGAALLFTATTQLQAQNPATSVAVDASANQHPINPNIYGIGGISDTSGIKALNVTLNRIGGNNESDYNWQQDAYNLDADWYFESFLQDGPPVVPGASTDNTIQNTYNANVGAEPMVTIPMLPYIAKVQSEATTGAASLWSFSIAKYGPQIADPCGNGDAYAGGGSADPYQTDAGSGIVSAVDNGGNCTYTYVKNDPTDAYVANSVSIETGYVQHLISKWGLSTTSTGIKYYVLDNEPSLWSGTHRDVHPSAETYQEEYNNIVAYATAIRSLDPNAKIVGPEEWTWWAMFESGLDQKNGTGAGSDYATHSDTYYYPWLLKQLYAYQQSSGIKMLDVLSVHCYDDGGAAANIETRELWDPGYVDPGWEGAGGIDINGGILEWIPLMKQWVNQYYPGLEIGCTEYSWGNDNSLTGATEQADVLGIFGLYGFDLATNWGAPPKPGYLAMQMYRNYDGNLSSFGDTSVSAQVADPDNLSAFAALRSSDGALTVVVINKQTGTTPVTVSLADFGTTGTAQAYQISSATQTAINSLGSVAVTNNAINFTAPSQSVTLFVIPTGSVTSAPTTPTGLAASVGNGAATLTWNAGGGATSYTLSRGSSSSGPFAAIATVTSPAPTTYTNTGLTNGTTYYYVVSGTNADGTSANSSPAVAATPLIPPTFTSSATASPNPVVQNSSTTVTATVKCTANTLTNGTVQIIAVDPSGNATTLKSFTDQNFTANETETYTATLTPALVGTYTLEVEVTSATGQQWSLNSTAGTVSVSSALSFTSTGTATPSSVAIGATTTIAVTVKNTGTVAYSNGNVEVQIFNASNTAVVTQVYSSQNIAAGASESYSFTWTPSSSTATGTYSVDVGAFDSSWSTDYYWNTDATITVTTASTTAAKPTFNPVGGTYAAAQSVTISDATAGVTIYYTTNGTMPTTSSAVYGSTPIPVSATGTTIKAIAAKTGLKTSPMASATYTLQATAPTLSLKMGTYTTTQSVTIGDTTSGAVIWYTTDGTTPVPGEGTAVQYNGTAVTIHQTSTLKAVAALTGWKTSSAASAIYTLEATAPTFSLKTGTYTTTQSVTFSDTTSGAVIWYTTDGTTPVPGEGTAVQYKGTAVPIGQTTTLKAVAALTGWKTSSAPSATYTLEATAPTFSLKAGTYTTAQSVTISDSTASTVIWYTTDGTTPVPGEGTAKQYTGTAVAIDATTTLKAVAARSDWKTSSVTSAVYTIK